MMTLSAEIAALGRVHWRAFRARTVASVRESRLMAVTIAVFLTGYLVAAYFMFCRGLDYMITIPGIGLLLTERIIYLSYFFFFVMLVFSNCILLYASVFRGKETAWLLTTPVNPRAVLCWKVVESFLVSSWGLAVLSAPLLASVGRTFGAGPWFYVKVLVLYPLFLMLPAMVASLLVLGLVRWWGRVLRWLLTVAVVVVGWWVVQGWRTSPNFEEIAAMTNLNGAFTKVMGHTELAMNRFLPSAWMAELILLWARGFDARGAFFGMVLASWALMLGWLCVVVASPAMYDAWNLSQRRKAMKTGRRGGTDEAAVEAAFRRGWVGRLPFLRRDTAALIRKDLREFSRDPAQWIPCAVVFGLLLVYASNLNRAMDSDPNRPLFRLILSTLNFAVCCLTLSTLTTRFIFPMFSLEGRRLWILGLSPVGLSRVFWQKLGLFAVLIGMATGVLMLVSGIKLGMSRADLVYYCGSIVLMSGGLTALALSLGAIFPNFVDHSPAKIVSGFGGTLCLILNFVYILGFLPIFVWPSLRAARPGVGAAGEDGHGWNLLISGVGLVVLTVLVAGVPVFFAIRKIKRLELLGKL